MAKGRTETGQKNQARSVWKTGYGQFFYDDEKEKLFSHMSQISSESMENNQKKASMKAKREFIASANAAADTRWAIQMVLPTAIGGKIAKAYAGYEAVETGVNAVSCANGNALGCVGAVAGISPIFRGTISVSRTLVGTSRVGMKKAAAKLIGNTPNHPLKFLLTPDGKLKSAFRKKHFEMIEDPTLLEMGHVTSHKSGEAEFIVLQSGWTNQFDNKTVVSVN
jgi:hypothetical protein